MGITVKGSYDSAGDVLYITKERAAATSDEDDMPGVLFRHAMDDKRHVGVTILDFRHFPRDLPALKARIATFLDVPEDLVDISMSVAEIAA